MNLPVVIAPTIASTDAPLQRALVIYTDDGEFDSYLMLPRQPEYGHVDTQIPLLSPGAPAGGRYRRRAGDPVEARCLLAAAPPPWRAAM